MAQSVLVTAAAGHIGSQLIPQLLKDNVKVVLPTSNASRLRASYPGQDVAVEEGSLMNPQWLTDIITKHSVDTIFLCLTGTSELMVTLNVFDVMRRTGVKRLVYLSGCGDYVSDQGFPKAMEAQSAMHVLVKTFIERKLRHTTYPWTTVRLGPTLFWDNDLRSKQSILNGLFDEPLGEAGVSRVSTEDIALAARNAIIDHDTWAGQKIMVGSQHKYTGTEIAGLWTQAIGKDVKILPANEKSFQRFEDDFIQKAQGGQYGPDAAAWGRDLRLMYEDFSVHGFSMTDEDYNKQVKCLGRPPRDYKDFVQETAKSWTT